MPAHQLRVQSTTPDFDLQFLLSGNCGIDIDQGERPPVLLIGDLHGRTLALKPPVGHHCSTRDHPDLLPVPMHRISLACDALVLEGQRQKAARQDSGGFVLSHPEFANFLELRPQRRPPHKIPLAL